MAVTPYWNLQKKDLILSAGFPHLFRPDAGLNFAHMGTIKKKHAKA
jgi:hypothetical protein